MTVVTAVTEVTEVIAPAVTVVIAANATTAVSVVHRRTNSRMRPWPRARVRPRHSSSERVGHMRLLEGMKR